MPKLKDLTGEKFGRWTVLKLSHKDCKRQYYWICKCTCGTIKIVNGNNLKLGKSLSCGCLARELNSEKHQLMKNKNRTKLYNKWSNMKNRCYNRNSSMYYRYGLRNIKVCDEWLDNFENFYQWAINNGYENGLTIDRIDNDKGYEPNNCRFVNVVKQANNRSNNHFVEYLGEIKTIAEWARILNLDYDYLKFKIRKNCNICDIVQETRG